MISANLEAMCWSEMATVRRYSTPSVIAVFSVVLYSSALIFPKIGMEGSKRQRLTPANAMMKYMISVTC
jgi:hypothetical protein